MDFIDTLRISAAGMRAQGVRLRVISENVANAESAGERPGDPPYRRKLVSFRNMLDREAGMNLVRVDRVRVDRTEFKKTFDPQHPAADADGYVLMPNVNPLVEMMDMREANRSYEANLAVIETSRGMLQRTIDLLR